MNVNCWGQAWTMLHCMTFNYPENPTSQNKHDYKIFFESISATLPCFFCRQSYQEYIKELPVEPFLESRQAFSWWLYLIHDKVQKKLNRISPSYFEVVKLYESYRAKCSKEKKGCVEKLNRIVTNAQIEAYVHDTVNKYSTESFRRKIVRYKTNKYMFPILVFAALSVFLIFVLSSKSLQSRPF